MDLSRWKVFKELDPEVSAQVKLAYTWDGNAGFIIMDNDDVYCIGEHSNGILAGKRYAEFPRKIEELCGQGVIDFQCGNNFVMALTEDGRVFEWVGKGKPKLREGFPVNTKVTQIAAGLWHRMALTSCGKVYCWGTNKHGQVGNGTFEEQIGPKNIILPYVGIESEQKIVTIACGRCSSFAVGENGNVWAWGDKQEVGNYRNGGHIKTPRAILRGIRIVKVVCSAGCTVAISQAFLVHYRPHHGQRRTIKRSSTDPILDAGSSIHSSFIAYSTAETVFVLGDWCDSSYCYPQETSYASVDEAFGYYRTARMCRPVKPFRSPEPTILDSLEALFDDGASSDLKFVVADRAIHAHKAFLEKRSAYFARMFGSDWKESSTGAIKVESYSPEVFRTFLYYLYTGKINNLDCAGMLELLKAADYYREEGLVRKCEQLIKLDVTVENVCLVYSIAAEHNAEELKRHTLEFSRHHCSEVLNSEGFAALDKRLITQLMRELHVKCVLIPAESSSSSESEEEQHYSEVEEVMSGTNQSDAGSDS